MCEVGNSEQMKTKLVGSALGNDLVGKDCMPKDSCTPCLATKWSKTNEHPASDAKPSAALLETVVIAGAVFQCGFT